MSDIVALLEELKIADYETYDKINQAIIHASSYWWPDIIQGCVQKAIITKGWGFIIASEVENWEWIDDDPGRVLRYYSCHLCVPDKEMSDFWDGRTFDAKGSTLAEALLRAYLQAVKA
jgi:hypothetical protein